MFDFDTQHNMKLLNDQLRSDMLEKAKAQESEYDKVKSICEDFLTYEYDYSVLLPQCNTVEPRRQKTKPFTFDGKTYYSGTVRMIDPDPKYHISLSPSVHALKMGTCASFSHELAWFAKELSIDYKIVDVLDTCYDNFSSANERPLIRDMRHRYIVMKFGGHKYKIDIAGALMARDYKTGHKDSKIDIKDFILVDENAENPFKHLKDGNQEPNMD